MTQKATLLLVLAMAVFTLTVSVNVKAAHYHKGHDMSVWMTFEECRLFLHDEHPEVVEVICDGLAGDNDGYDTPELT